MKVLKNFVFPVVLVLLLLILSACTPEGELLPEWKGPISVFVQSLIEVLFVPLLVMGIAWLAAQVRTLWKNFKLKNPQESEWITYVIQTVVLAAEQMAEAYPDMVTDKKAWAIERAEAWFTKLGLELDLDEISDLIEAEVKALFNIKLPEENAP